MVYHITVINNTSNKSVTLTNPVTPKDSILITPNTAFQFPTPPQVNTLPPGNHPYLDAVHTALNIYTFFDNFCFWDNTNSAVQWVGEDGETGVTNIGAGNLELTITTKGTIHFQYAVAKAAATV
jgi:hypothetical protein